MLKFSNVSKKYGSAEVLKDLSFSVPSGQTTVLLGPSGCGKSTLLRIAAGLVWPDSGEVRLEQKVVNAESLSSIRRRIGYVIQEGGLFPHLTARENVLLVPRHLKWPVDRQASRVEELAQITQLSPELLERYPSELSGGQRQRVSLMRALVMDPPILLLDEPLGALDPIIRRELQSELREIFKRLEKTALLVTHDVGEAAYLGHQILLLRAGRVVQSGSVADFVERPADAFVTEFVNAQRSLV